MVSRSLTETESRSIAITYCDGCTIFSMISMLLKHILLYCTVIIKRLFIYSQFSISRMDQTHRIDCHFVRDEIQAQWIVPAYIPINAQPFDIITKALGQS